jgi:hypothetical protein
MIAMNRMHVVLIVSCLGVSATATDAQSQPSAAEQFLADARAGTARYHDRRAAIADGYRKLGPAFPGMGEHWVHPGPIVNGRLDARTPSVLGYADIDGVPTLIGLAYAVPVLPGGTPPATPMGSAIWHEHSDAVDDETLLLVHGDAAAGDTTRPRLAMFHAWTSLDNPDGPFAQNNWALPFAQLGLTPPPAVSAAAAQAASLLTVGEAYWLKLLDALVQPTSAERRALQTAVGRAGERVTSWRESLEHSTVMPDGAALLERIWVDLWDDLENAVTGDARTRLKSYGGHPAAMHSSPHAH